MEPFWSPAIFTLERHVSLVEILYGMRERGAKGQLGTQVKESNIQTRAALALKKRVCTAKC